MKKIGLVINPIAGMGGAVGLKGTDGVENLDEAIKRGATKIAKVRSKITLKELRHHHRDFSFLTCSDEMGEDALRELNYSKFKIVYTQKDNDGTSAYDTKSACAAFLKPNVSFILFAGGDGTARDIFSVVRDDMPILGIPCGVKMHSSVFAINPKMAAEIAIEYLHGKLEVKDSEIMDTDEYLYRKNQLATKVFGYAKTPYKPNLVQRSKSVFVHEDEEESKSNIATFADEFMNDDSLYIIGAGTTTKAIFDKIGLEKSLLGVDIVKNKQLIKKDVNEKDILEIIESEKKVKILISPIGAQGFIFGRGNQQISAEIIKKVGVENVIILATPYKLSQTPTLLVDTGDIQLDKELSGYKRIVTGYRIAQLHEIKAYY